MNDEFDYAEVVIHTCTGDTTVLSYDKDDIRYNRFHAEQVASIVRVIARSGQDMSRFKDGHAPVDWFRSFPDWAHITFVCVADRNSLTGDTVPYLPHSFGCAHTTVEEENTA